MDSSSIPSSSGRVRVSETSCDTSNAPDANWRPAPPDDPPPPKLAMDLRDHISVDSVAASLKESMRRDVMIGSSFVCALQDPS